MGRLPTDCPSKPRGGTNREHPSLLFGPELFCLKCQVTGFIRDTKPIVYRKNKHDTGTGRRARHPRLPCALPAWDTIVRGSLQWLPARVMFVLPRWHTQRCGRCPNSRYLYGQRRGLPPRRQLRVRPEHDEVQSCAIALRSPARAEFRGKFYRILPPPPSSRHRHAQ